MLRHSRSGTVLAAAAIIMIGGLVSPTWAQSQEKPKAGIAFPSPGDSFASPEADLTLRGLDPAALGDITVTGSATGAHDGTLRPLPDGLGTTFDLAGKFQPGETVTVDLPPGTTVRGGSDSQYSFTVAQPKPAPDAKTLHKLYTKTPAAKPKAEPRTAKAQCTPQQPSYITRPNLEQADGACVAEKAQRTGEGLLFTTPGQNNVTIFNDNAQTVWQEPASSYTADAKVVQYRGQDMLAFTRAGKHILLNKHYQRVATISAADGYKTDMHELWVTPRGTAYIGIYAPVVVDMSDEGGNPGTTVYDYVVQEIDIATGAKLFEWHALDHVDISDSYLPPPTDGSRYDWFHGNAITVDNDGNLLVSGRHTWSAYKINRMTGDLMWTLGGKNSSFDPLTAGPGVPKEEARPFCSQHNIRALPNGNYTLYDNGGGVGGRCGPARGLVLDLNPDTGEATITHSYRHSPDLKSYFMGNMQSLPDGNKVVGWGSLPRVTEFHSDGSVALDMRLSANSYRAFRFEWTGLPTAPPAVAARVDNGAMTVFTSWNGSTEVTQWQVMTGDSVENLSPAGPPQPKAGFETALRLDSPAHVVRVKALDAEGNVLDTSPPLFWSAATGAHVVNGAILDEYKKSGGPNGPLGYPTTDEKSTPDGVGRYNHFSGSGGGSIYWTPRTGAHAVYGAIRDKWAELGWEQGLLGYPTTSETKTSDKVGRFNHFSGSGGGSIFWTPNTGAHAVYGEIHDKWAQLGWEQGPLGYPTTDEKPTPDGVGRYNHFSGSDGGSIYWSPDTGAREVYGRIRDHWAALGWEKSYLGYPTSGEFNIPGGRRNNFQAGYIEWNAASDSTADHPYAAG